MKNKVYNLFEICNPKQWKTISIDNLDKNAKYPVYGANGVIGYYFEYNHEKPTLCITCRGATSGELNISTSYSYINGNTMALDDLDETKVDINFLYYYLKKRGFKDIISGSAQPQITRISLKKINIPLYTLNFQKKVASNLKKIEDIIKFKKNQLLNLTELVKSLFTIMFGDIKTNDKNWEIKKLGEVIQTQYGTSKKATSIVTGFPILRMNNITYSGEMDYRDLKYIELSDNEKEKFLLKKGELLFNRTNSKELVGKTGLFELDTPMAFAGYLIRMNPSNLIHSKFLLFFMNSEFMKKLLYNKAKNIVGMANINAKELEDFSIILPPIELQNKFAERIEKIEKLKFEIEKSIETAQNLYDSLISKYFDN